MESPKSDLDKKWDLLKQIIRTDALQDLKIKNKGFFYKVQDDLVLRIIAKAESLESLQRHLSNPHALIEEHLPRSKGWK